MARSSSSDAVLFVGLGIFAYYAARIAHKQLLAVRAAAEITREEEKDVPELISQHTEDALKLKTLRELVDGANGDIRTAAIKIVTERATHGKTYSLLLEEIASKNPTRRLKALTSLKYLTTSPSNKENIYTYRTCRALTICLVDFLPPPAPVLPGSSSTSPSGTQVPDTNISTRTPTERLALQILSRILPCNLPCALRAGVVTDWLAKYPFGNIRSVSSPPSSTQERCVRDIIQRLRMDDIEDPVMCEILYAIYMYPAGRKALRLAGLVGSAIDEEEEDNDNINNNITNNNIIDDWNTNRDNHEEREEEEEYNNNNEDRDGDDILMVGGEDTAGVTSLNRMMRAGGGGTTTGRQRVRDESLEEQALRRRRREAMVLSEGGRPLNGGDIIQRGDGRRGGGRDVAESGITEW
ncbi:hypothetical protein MMC09_004099 [Bachmanniomyces sp. S44760]|nr:hypothetical protein [Bachmanniomyces sp. S44760]